MGRQRSCPASSLRAPDRWRFGRWRPSREAERLGEAERAVRLGVGAVGRAHHRVGTGRAGVLLGPRRRRGPRARRRREWLIGATAQVVVAVTGLAAGRYVLEAALAVAGGRAVPRHFEPANGYFSLVRARPSDAAGRPV